MGFFSEVLPHNKEGWTPLILRSVNGGLTDFQWFKWPDQEKIMDQFVENHTQNDVYFSPFLYSEPPSLTDSRHATKLHVVSCSVIWADGDDLPYDNLRIKPHLYVQTSQNHWQGYWLLEDENLYLPEHWESFSRSLYEAHKGDGIDAGWPLAKKMRVPGTTNTKSEQPFQVTWEVRNGEVVTGDEFSAVYPANWEDSEAALSEPVPTELPAPMAVLGRLQDARITQQFVRDDYAVMSDRSGAVYHLACLLWEAGASLEETFAVIRGTAYYKYEGRSEGTQWAQLLRDRAKWEEGRSHLGVSLPKRVESDAEAASEVRQDSRWGELSLLEPGEVVPMDTFVDAFVEWASSKSSQADESFHVCGALSTLSTVFSQYAYLHLTFGTVPLNLFFLVLGRTTQSRKTTSLRLSQKILSTLAKNDADPDRYMLPDDATPEGLSVFLSQRPNASSLLAIDEVQDMFAAGARKSSYMAGLVPFITKAYDGRIPGILRKTGDKKFQPSVPHYMSFYGTGIFDQAAKALTPEKIASGFIPRCLVAVDSRRDFITGEDDLTYINDSGPGTEIEDSYEALLYKWATNSKERVEERYYERAKVRTYNEDPRVPLTCEPAAFDRWKRFASYTSTLAAEHPTNSKELFPTVTRMNMSTLKIAGLLALSEAEYHIQMRHVLKAITFASIWMPSLEAMVFETVHTDFARSVDELIEFVAKQRNHRVSYAKLATHFQTKIKSSRDFLDTLAYAQQRGALAEYLTDKGRFIEFKGYVK